VFNAPLLIHQDTSF